MAMASLGHVAVGLAVARAHEGRFKWKAAVAFATFSLVPDLDVIAFRFGIPYAAPFGHRGATHSIVFALAMGVAAWLLTRSWKSTLAQTVVVLSHSRRLPLIIAAGRPSMRLRQRRSPRLKSKRPRSR